MKVTFKTGSEVNYGNTNGELFFASNTKQIMLNGIKYIPKKLSELTNDSGFISSITKSMVEGVLTGNITSHTHQYAASPSINGAATTLYGKYTRNGGQQNPNYFGKKKVGALMMNTTVNGNTQYKDWIISDCYTGNDAGGAVAFGVNREKLGAYIMRSASERTEWAESAELLGTHNYASYALPLSGGTLTGNLTCNGSYINMSGTSGATGYRGYFNNSQSNRAAGSHIFQPSGWAYGENATSIGYSAYAGIRNTDSDSGTYPYLHWQWMDCLQVKEVTSAGDVNCYGAILNNLGGAKDTAKFTVCVDGVCVSYDESKGEDDATNQFLKFTNTDANYGRVVVFIVDNDATYNKGLIFGGNTSHPRRICSLKIGNMILGQGSRIADVASMSINGKTVYRLAIYWWSGNLSASYDITKATTAMVCTKVNNSSYIGAYSVASGNYSVASGYYSVASGYSSVASGNSSVASGNSSVASGYYSVASGYSSVASGYSSVASGNSSVASGYYSVASGNYSVASGYYSVASGTSSVAKHEGSKVYALRGVSGNIYQTVLGMDNVETSGAVVVGWGSSDANRKNIFVLDTDGNATFGSGGAASVTAATFNGSLNGNATNASKLSSHTISELTYASIFTYTSNLGILVQTDFNASSDAHVCAHIWGSGYNSVKPINTYIQFLNYNNINQIINYACFHYGLDLGNVYAFSYNGNLCFWFDISKWIYQTIYVFVSTNSGDVINHVASLSRVAKPTDGVAREVTIKPKLNAFIDSNVASASKLATARTIKIGSASKSFDGSGDIEFTLNNIITQYDTINVGELNVAEQLTTKNITIGNNLTISSGAGISGLTPSMIGALENKYIAHKESYLWYVILLCKTGTNTTNKGHTINGMFYTHNNGAQRYQAAYVNIHSADWSTSHNEYYGFTPFGLGRKCRLVTCTYQGAQYLAITFENIPEVNIYFDGSSTNILFTPILYYTENTQTINNSEIYNSIADVVYNKTSILSSSETALTSSNFNSYALPLSGGKLTGTLNMPGQQINAGSITVSDSISAGSISANSISCGNKDVSLVGHTHTFTSLTNKPTTLSGYGITDAYTKTETNTELGKYLPLTGGTLNGALTVPKLTSTGGILLGDSSLSAMVGSVGIQRHDETGFIGFLKDFNLGNSFNGVVLGWDGNYSLQENSVRIDASTFTYKGNSVLHSGNLGYISSGLSRAVQKDTNGNLFIVAPSLFEQGISNNYPKNLRWSNENEGQLVYDKEIEAGNFDTVEIGIPLANGTSKGFLKSTSTITNVTGYTPCPVVSGTPYYKLDAIELDYTDFLEIGSGNIESHLPITIKVQEGGSLKYLFDYTVDNIPRLLTISAGNFCKYFFWLQQTDDDTPIVAYYHCQFNDLWLVIDSPNMEVRISQGTF